MLSAIDFANEAVERMAAGGRSAQFRVPGAAAIAHFFVMPGKRPSKLWFLAGLLCALGPLSAGLLSTTTARGTYLTTGNRSRIGSTNYR